MTETNGDNKKSLIGIIIQAGAVGISFVCLWIIYNLVSNHFYHNTEILIKLEASINQNNDLMTENSNALKELEKTLEIFITKGSKF